MSVEQKLPPKNQIVYPESDGKPMADNTKQFRWIYTIQTGFDWLYEDDPNVFVAGDLLWYPVEGSNTIRQAPDTMIVLGRPKGDRGSYQQWNEGNIAPQVVFEVWSPGNRSGEMSEKRDFYQQYGVQEYYEYDPDRGRLFGWIYQGNKFVSIHNMQGFVSPLTGVRFGLNGKDLELITADGEMFVNAMESRRQTRREKARADREKARADQERAAREQEKARADQERLRADQERAAREQEKARADQERAARERSWAKLRELGIDPESL
jgi:Uma2 family endonuclease